MTTRNVNWRTSGNDSERHVSTVRIDKLSNAGGMSTSRNY